MAGKKKTTTDLETEAAADKTAKPSAGKIAVKNIGGRTFQTQSGTLPPKGTLELDPEKSDTARLLSLTDEIVLLSDYVPSKGMQELKEENEELNRDVARLTAELAEAKAAK